jgi:hypothetical protein
MTPPTGPNEAARGVVSSYAIKNDKRLLLFDPRAVPSEFEELVVGSEAVVVLALRGTGATRETSWSDSAHRYSRLRRTRTNDGRPPALLAETVA